MRNQELATLRQELLENRVKIEEIMAKQSVMEEELQEYNEVNDIMSKSDESAEEISEVISQLAVTESLEKTLKDINQALEMMNKGTYGECKYCNKQIPIARMRIRPVSTSCVECKSRFTN
jgi:RNA polymerase-binding protein DksA